MNCLHCQQDLAAGAKFCTQCGGKVAVCCPACQADCAIDSKFCSRCGGKMPVADDADARNANAGDRRVVTVLFTDVSGFTSMSEKLKPEEVTTIVNDFFAVLTEPIYRFGGVVDKYIGDAIMALFGAPIAHEDDPERAVYAGYEMQRNAAEFADDLEKRTGIRLRVRIGINTGLVVAGSVGGSQKRDYTVMGETVNLAQRMESTAKVGKVLVTYETYRLANQAMEFLELPPVTVPGKSFPISTFEVIGPRAAVTEAKRERSTFVGRKAELETLTNCWEQALAGRPQWVVVNGEAGIGKSRLLAQFAQTRCLPSPLIMRARCQSYTSTSSFGLLAGLLHYWIDLPSTASSSELRAGLVERCAAVHPADGARIADLLGLFLGMDIQDPENASLSQEQRRNAALKAFNAMIVTLSRSGPMLLSFEDLQWADAASLEWFGSLLEAVSHEGDSLQLLIVCQHRPEAASLPGDRWRRDRSVLQLRALETEESLAIAAAFLRCAPAGLADDSPIARIIAQVVDRAAGNPFYLHELITTLLDAGHLVAQADGSWHVATDIASIKLPTNIQGAVASRLDRLERHLKGVLQIGAIIGRTFTLEMVEHVGKRETDNVNSLQELCRLGFLYANSQRGYSFTQPLIQEVAYESLLMSSRKDLHARTGWALEVMFAQHLDENAPVLAHHFLKGDQPAPAYKYLVASSRRSFGVYDLGRAREDLTQARTLAEALGDTTEPPKWEVLWLLGQVLTLGSHYDEAFEVLDQALNAAPTVSERASILLTKGDALERKGEFQLALESYQSGYEALPAEGRPEHAGLLSKMGYARYRLGQHDECIRLCKEAIAALEGTGRLKDLAFAHSYISICHWRRGDSENATQHAEAGLRYRESAKDLAGVAASYANLANILTDRGDWEKADEYYRRSLEAYERIGDPYFISLLHNNLGTHLISQGGLDEAEDHFRQALDLKKLIGDRAGEGIALFNVGDAQYRRGKGQLAVTTMQEALAIFHELDSREFFPEVYLTIAKVFAELAATDEAWRFLEQAREYGKEQSDDGTLAIVPRVESLLVQQAGDLPRAKELAESAVALIAEQDSPLELGRAYAQLASVAGALGDVSAQTEAIKEARIRFEQLGARLELDNLDQLALVR